MLEKQSQKSPSPPKDVERKVGGLIPQEDVSPFPVFNLEMMIPCTLCEYAYSVLVKFSHCFVAFLIDCLSMVLSLQI